jgi:hypothetical protein
MNCAYSREILALYIEDDLPIPDAARKVESHVLSCADCQHYCEQLRKTQSFIKSRLRSAPQESVTQEVLKNIRRTVMSQIGEVQQSLGWAVKLERFLTSGLRKQRFALAGFAVAAIVSVSLLGQMRYSAQKTSGATTEFSGEDRLLQPTGYREWVFVGASLGHGDKESKPFEMSHNVYINPGAYREYVRTGRFPDGTVMVLETLSVETIEEPEFHGSYEKDFLGLKVSVKDSSRFDDGWGFYDFTEATGKLRPEAEALPQTASCLSCHRDRGATDHVFTQFYPVLRGIGS